MENTIMNNTKCIENNTNAASKKPENLSFFFKMADKADRFEAVEQQLELFIENTRQLGIIVSDFQPQGQNVLNQKL